jgi:hypothetical protein
MQSWAWIIVALAVAAPVAADDAGGPAAVSGEEPARPEDTAVPETLPDGMAEMLAGSDPEERELIEALPEADGPIDSAEDEPGPLPFRFEASLQGMLSAPFAGQPGNLALGYAITYGVGYGSLPLLIGLDFMSASSSAGSSFELPADEARPALTLRQDAQNRTLYFDLWARVQPLRWPVRPYVEGFIGTKLAQARYALRRADAEGGTAQNTSAQDWSSSLGYGAGVDFAGLLQLADSVSITLGFRRLHSGGVVLDARTDVAGRSVAARSDIAGPVTLFSIGIIGWLELSRPANPDANF